MSSEHSKEKITNWEPLVRNRKLINRSKFMSDNLLLLLTLLGVILGAVLGFGLRHLLPTKTAITLVCYPGELFMRMLKLLILPFIISSLIVSSASLNPRLSGRIVLRTLLYFLATSFINAVLGVILASSIRPGHSNLKTTVRINREGRATSILDTFLDLGRNLIADNIFEATFEQVYTNYVNVSDKIFNETGNYFYDVNITMPILKHRPGTNNMGLLVFCLAFGITLGTLGQKAKVVTEFFSGIFEVILKMVTRMIWLTPIGVCSVIAGKILVINNIALVMSQLGWFIATILIGVLIDQLIILQLIYFLFVRQNPFKFYAGLAEATLTASALASTAAALPVTFPLLENKLKVDSRITRFVLPIGCNINLDGTALFIAAASVFIAQTNNITLNIGELVIVCFTATAASFCSASIPSAGVVLILIVLSAINVPSENLILLFAIDWCVDRIRTTSNMLGDCYAAAVVETLSKKELRHCDGIILQNESDNNLDNHTSTILIEEQTNIHESENNDTT